MVDGEDLGQPDGLDVLLHRGQARDVFGNRVEIVVWQLLDRVGRHLRERASDLLVDLRAGVAGERWPDVGSLGVLPVTGSAARG